MKRPFFGGGLIVTREQYINQTYSADDFFGKESDSNSGVASVTEVHTWFHGRCFLAKVSSSCIRM